MEESKIGTRRAFEAAPAHDVTMVRASADGGGDASAVAWAAIIGGAFAAIAITIILISLGTGFGLTSVSAQSNGNASATTFGVVAAIWFVVVQWLASGVGGYTAGRLRTKWTGLHSDEVFFRDTMHGFLAWATATLIVVVVASSAGTAALRGVAGAAAPVASGLVQMAGQGSAGSTQEKGQADAGAVNPVLDGLFRSTNASAVSDQDAHGSAAGILMGAALKGGELAPDDRTYLAQIVAAKTGISQADAEQRVDRAFAQVKDAEAQARQAAETARKTAATIAIMTALSMLIGAFVASAAGAYGGRIRDL